MAIVAAKIPREGLTPHGTIGGAIVQVFGEAVGAMRCANRRNGSAIGGRASLESAPPSKTKCGRGTGSRSIEGRARLVDRAPAHRLPFHADGQGDEGRTRGVRGHPERGHAPGGRVRTVRHPRELQPGLRSSAPKSSPWSRTTAAWRLRPRPAPPQQADREDGVDYVGENKEFDASTSGELEVEPARRNAGRAAARRRRGHPRSTPRRAPARQ